MAAAKAAVAAARVVPKVAATEVVAMEGSRVEVATVAVAKAVELEAEMVAWEVHPVVEVAEREMGMGSARDSLVVMGMVEVETAAALAVARGAEVTAAVRVAAMAAVELRGVGMALGEPGGAHCQAG